MSPERKPTPALNVSAIRNGTVIDHIRNDSTFKVAEILNLMHEGRMVLIGVNLPSGRLGRKGLVKIEDREVTPEEANKIALIAPEATLNIIKDYRVIEKRKVELPQAVEGFVRCINPSCVSNQQEIESSFDVIGTSPPTLRCVFCERVMSGRDIMIK
jgi:aspartate carbamoyltransferase regulatory subunit